MLTYTILRPLNKLHYFQKGSWFVTTLACLDGIFFTFENDTIHRLFFACTVPSPCYGVITSAKRAKQHAKERGPNAEMYKMMLATTVLLTIFQEQEPDYD